MSMGEGAEGVRVRFLSLSVFTTGWRVLRVAGCEMDGDEDGGVERRSGIDVVRYYYYYYHFSF